MGKNSRRPAGPAVPSTFDEGTAVPVVGAREACPCGSGKRYKLCHGRASREQAARLVTRPFEGLAGECDWIAMREIVPAATATVRTTSEHGGTELTVATVLPMAWPGLRRQDGAVLLGLQAAGASGDPSRDIADALLRGLAAEPGTPIVAGELPGPGPRLQDVLEPGRPFEVTVHGSFDFWLQADHDLTQEERESMELANRSATPTTRLASVDAAYWCQPGERCHLRWVLPHDETTLLNALARLHVAGGATLVEGSRYIGSFRAHGLLVPVWDVPTDVEPAELEDPAKSFAVRLDEAMADTAPLTADERRARAGVVSRQVTLR